jgi:hypothetical protein
MASYFVTCHPLPDGAHAVHDRTLCPPACFSGRALEYLGEFGNPVQAVAVARLRYEPARACAWYDLVVQTRAARHVSEPVAAYR